MSTERDLLELQLADVVLDKTKATVTAYKKGYLKGYKEGLEAGRNEKKAPALTPCTS